VPAELVGQVRIGLQSVLGDAAEEITDAVERPECERHPEWFHGGRTKFERTFALLDVIGWRESDQRAAVRFDLGEHRRALIEALEVMLRVGEDDLEEADLVDTERAQRGETPKRNATAKRVRTLREFAAGVESINEEEAS
jgi:hypothetical protein